MVKYIPQLNAELIIGRYPGIPPSQSFVQDKAASSHVNLTSKVADGDFMKSELALTNEGALDGSGLKVEGMEAGWPSLQVRSYIRVFFFYLAWPFLYF